MSLYLQILLGLACTGSCAIPAAISVWRENARKARIAREASK